MKSSRGFREVTQQLRDFRDLVRGWPGLKLNELKGRLKKAKAAAGIITDRFDRLEADNIIQAIELRVERLKRK
jgi:hypothetical protein